MLNCGLVLEGGGLRGNYTAGVLDAFLGAPTGERSDEGSPLAAGLEFPYLIGVSAGVGYGCSFVSKQRGRNLEILKRFRDDPRYLSIRNLVFTGCIFGMDFVFHEIPVKHVWFDFDTFMKADGRFVSVCTDIDTGEAVYYDKPQAKEGESAEALEHRFFTILEASASMPYVSRPVSYDGRRLLDGAITDAIPLEKAVADGFEKNIVVLTNPEGFRKKNEVHPPNGLFYSGKRKLVEALDKRVSRYNRSLDHVEEEAAAGRVLIIRPSVDLGVSRVEKSTAKLVRLYELGIADGKAALAAVKSF